MLCLCRKRSGRKEPTAMMTLTTLTTRIVLGLATFGFTGLLSATPAQAAPAGGKDRSELKAGRLCDKLACSADQKAKIRQIKVASNTPQHKAARDNLRALKLQRQAERSKPAPDARTLTGLDAQVTAQKAALHSQRDARNQQILALLSVDQKAKFQAHLAARQGGKHKRGNHGKHGKRPR